MGALSIDTRPLASALAAEVHEVDLSSLDDETFAQIESALYRYGVLVFSGQRISHADQVALTLRFGEHGVDAFTDGVEGYRAIQPVIREPGPGAPLFFGARWHTDSPFLERPPAISMLRSVEVPPFGGDTLFSSSRSAYQALSEGMKRLLEPLQGLYSRTHLTRAMEQWREDTARALDISPVEQDLAVATAHPLVRTHPVTEEKALYVDENYTIGIAGMHRREAEPIIRYLVSHVTQPILQFRLRWQPDMLVIWDNRLVIHQAFDDFAPHRREMYRSTVLGEVPA